MASHGGGRKISHEWNEVILIENDTKVACKHCKEMISRKIERIKSHLKKCRAKVRNEEMYHHSSSELSTVISSEDNEILSLDENIPAENDKNVAHTSQNIKKRKLQTSMSSFLIKTTKEEQVNIDKKIAAFFYSANIPFSVIESTQFLDMISSLRPGYIPPNRKQLSGILLNEASEEIEQKMKTDIDNEATITLIQDGWSNVRNDPIIGTSLHTGKQTYLLKITDAGSNRKTTEYCTENMLASIKECKNKFGKDVFAICTDNEAKMKKMRTILKDHYPDIITVGCSAHFLNLLAKELSPITLLNQIIEVQKYFRNIHQPHGWLKEYNCIMPKIPNSTRWNSHKECISSILKIFHTYVTIASQHEDEFDSRISNILNNVGIYKEALILEKQLSLISASLNKLQSDSSTLSFAVEIWKDLIESDELKYHKKIIEVRYKESMEAEHFLAYMMDPHFQGKRLTSEEESKAENWILEKHPEWLPAVMAFKIKDEEFFPKSLFEQSILSHFSAVKWWKILKEKVKNNNKFDAAFYNFFISLHAVSPTSASIERIFSTFSFIWSKLRNRLAHDQCEKLVKIYKYYHQNEKEESNW